MVLDVEGIKMSKHVGNVIDPEELIGKYGADVLRWFLVNGSQIWLPKRFDEKGMVEALRKFFSTLQNSYSFFALYAALDKFDPASKKPDTMPFIDTWLISRLNGTIKNCIQAYDSFDFTRASRLIATFVIDELSNWWIKRSRKRFWGADISDDKLSAYHVLFESLITICKLMAPISPFMAEDIYRRLTEDFDGFTESVHHCEYPVANEGRINKELDHAMASAENIVRLGRAARKQANIKVRQPLPRLVVIYEKGAAPAGLSDLLQIILEELNVKKLDFSSDWKEYFTFKAEPLFNMIGPRHGKLAPRVANAVKALTPEQIIDIQKQGSIKIKVDESEKVLTSEEIAINVVPENGFAVAVDSHLKVVLDLALTDELLAEGFARELVNKIQNMRRNAGFEVTDRIKLGVSSSEQAEKAIKMFGDYIKNETLAVLLDDQAERKIKKEWNINGVTTLITLEKN